MINCLYKTLQIDVAYSVNSLIYTMVKMPYFRDMFDNNVYDNRNVKKIVGIVGMILSFLRALFVKVLYLIVIFEISKTFYKDNYINCFYHMYFVLTILGLFINNRLLTTSKKKYFSIVLFQMDANQFLRANYLWDLLNLVIYNLLGFFVISLFYKISITSILILILLSLVCRIIGETLNMMFYKKYLYVWYGNTKLYFPIFLFLIACCFLPFFNIIISMNTILFVSIIFAILSIFAVIYIFRIDDYKVIYKSLSQVSDVMDSKNESNYYRQALVNMKDKDKEIDSKILEKKHGYDLFNTIFFKRHREIMFRSAKNCAIIATVVYAILIYYMSIKPEFRESIGNFLHIKLSWFVLIMYFLNRGAAITQAMFYNCDHAMLTYNFYREPDTLLGLFKRRLINIVLINLIPSFVVGIGNTCLLYYSSVNCSLLTYITSFIFIISLSMFFSVHYLVIYYLLQPFNKNMQMKKMSYSVVSFLTYFITFELTYVVVNSNILSIFGIIFVVIYIVISLILVYRIAPRTFKIY